MTDRRNPSNLDLFEVRVGLQGVLDKFNCASTEVRAWRSLCTANGSKGYMRSLVRAEDRELKAARRLARKVEYYLRRAGRESHG